MERSRPGDLSGNKMNGKSNNQPQQLDPGQHEEMRPLVIHKKKTKLKFTTCGLTV